MWHSADPKAEVSKCWSIYASCYNKPLRLIDPDGMQAGDLRWDYFFQGLLDLVKVPFKFVSEMIVRIKHSFEGNKGQQLNSD